MFSDVRDLFWTWDRLSFEGICFGNIADEQISSIRFPIVLLFILRCRLNSSFSEEPWRSSVRFLLRSREPWRSSVRFLLRSRSFPLWSGSFRACLSDSPFTLRSGGFRRWLLLFSEN